MRWFACVALCSTLGVSVAVATPARADSSGLAVGSASSSSSSSSYSHWHKHHDAANSYGGTACFAAATLLWQQGYRSIEATDCYGSSYRFRATSNLTRYEVDVNSSTGQVIFIRPR